MLYPTGLSELASDGGGLPSLFCSLTFEYNIEYYYRAPTLREKANTARAPEDNHLDNQVVCR